MKVLIVLYHHRDNSLTRQIKSHFERGLKEAGHEVDTLDLYKMNFKPIVDEKDEPEWTAPEQHYAADVVKEQERLMQYDAVSFVFPIFWWSMPAMLKGYFDRVWSFGFAYGPQAKLNLKKCLWLPLTGSPREVYDKYKYKEMIERYFNTSIADYCGIKDSKLVPFHNTVQATSGDIQKFFEEAYQQGLNFHK